MTRFITLAGKKQVGKDTAAGMIKELFVPVRAEKQSNGCMDALFEEGRYAGRVHITHFADALKQACHIIFGIDLRDMESENGKRKVTDVVWPLNDSAVYGLPTGKAVWTAHDGHPVKPKFMTVREVLQFVGTELFRLQMDPDTWVKSVYRKPWAEDDIVIVADCRFPNEAEFAKEHGLLISIERDTGLASDGHISETSLDTYKDYHFIIDNNGSFDDLREHLRLILKKEGFTS